MARVRVHQHVNPLAPYFRFTPKALDLETVFADPTLPIHLDIGSARGRYLIEMAEIDNTHNFLGVEIREPLVIEGNQIKTELGLANLQFEFVNATLSIQDFLANLPAIQTITIQFPDPWYKKKHAKRRMVDLPLARAVAEKLAENGRIFVQTDVEFLAEEMFSKFREVEILREIAVQASPFPIKTEREKAVEKRQLPIYRAMFERIN
jgi:tRNA (guanine-N7-)-methyltransferase